MSHASTGRWWWWPGLGLLLYVNAVLYKNKRKWTGEGGNTGFEQEQPESFMNSFSFALCLTPRPVACGGGPGLAGSCVVVVCFFTKTKGNGHPLVNPEINWCPLVNSGLEKYVELIGAHS